MKLNLEDWEVGMILAGLAELPYEESAATIYKIKEQMESSITYCKDCVWFAPIESVPSAENMHKKLHELFDGILPKRDGEVGVCRKITFCAEHPVTTNENGYCHRAERKEIE